MPRHYKHRSRPALYGVRWGRSYEGSVTERRVPEGMSVAARRAWMHAKHAKAEGVYGVELLASAKIADRRRLLRGVSDATIRYACMEMGREHEHWVRAVIWLLRMLSPLGWRGHEIERNPRKRARIEASEARGVKAPRPFVTVHELQDGCGTNPG